MENKKSINHGNGNDANRLLAAALSRVVKFRAFVETYNGKEMVNDWCFLNQKDNHFNAVDLTNERPDIGEVFSVMQFTGLKDKNGIEIYEGDILCNDEYQTWEWRGVVKFSHGVFGAEWLSNVKSQSMVGSWGQKHNLRKLDDDIVERQIVIGNIYENPELLVEPS